MKLEITDNYCAIVTTVTVSPHPNADRLQLAAGPGFDTVAVGLEVQTGDVMVFFPSGTQLSEKYATENDLVRRKDENGNVAGGLFDANRKVRVQKLRSVPSDGYLAPLASLTGFGVSVDDLKVGSKFNTINDQLVCEKFIPKHVKNAQANAKAKQRKDNELFPKHIETRQFRYEVDQIPAGSLLSVTLKMHGTCLVGNSRIKLWDGTVKKIRDVKVGDVVVGWKNYTFVPSKVLDSFQYPKDSRRWWEVVMTTNGFVSNPTGHLVCTEDHLIFTLNRGWVEAQHLTCEDSVPSAKRDTLLSDAQRQVLLASMMGDGSLTIRPGGSGNIVFSHKLDHQGYAEWKAYLLGDLMSQCVDKKTSGYGTSMVRYRTKEYLSITELCQPFIVRNGDKRNFKSPPSEMIEECTPMMLAIWYMDDGSRVHNENQRDRASIAICDYTEEGRMVAQSMLSKFGIESVLYSSTNKRNQSKQNWRLRLNYRDAEKLWDLIAEYVPECMQYKLPEEWRGRFEFGRSKPGVSEPIYTSIPQNVLESKPFASQSSNRQLSKLYDIQTETQNFVAHNIVVHNSARYCNVWEPEAEPKKFFEKLKWKITGRKPHSHVPVKLIGTRNVIIGTDQKLRDTTGGYYGDDSFRYKVWEPWVEFMHPGEIVYGEIVGYVDGNSPIMSRHSTKSLKDKNISKLYGNEVTYSYGCQPGECKFYVYRVVHISQNGWQTELPWAQVKQRARQLGLETVPEMSTQFVYDGDQGALESLVYSLDEGPDLIDPTHPREGVVVRFDTQQGTSHWVKSKGLTFRLMEGIASEDETQIDLEDVS